MRHILRGRVRYLIGLANDSSDDASSDADVVRSDVSVGSVLRRCIDDHFDMQVLRTLLAVAERDANLNMVRDIEVVERCIALVASGRLRLLGPVPKLDVATGVPTEAAVAPAAAVARPAPPPPRGAPIAPPSFSSELDAAALAATLIEASKAGTPFCEECARAARAA